MNGPRRRVCPPGRRAERAQLGRACFLLFGSVLFASPLFGFMGGAQGWEGPATHSTGPADRGLERARSVERRWRARGAEAESALFERVLRAYQSVHIEHPQAAVRAAEAAFRAGRLLALQGRNAEALREYDKAQEVGSGTPYAKRARMERAHLERRARRFDAALQGYLVLATDVGLARRVRDEAWHWSAWTWKAAGQREAARRAWIQLSNTATDPRRRLVSFDERGLMRIEEGDLEAAAGVLHECLRALHGDALEETENGERVRRGLLNMRLVARLPREVQRRNRSRESEGTPRIP